MAKDKRNDRIIALRESLGLTQAEFARVLGVSPGYIGDVERCHRAVSLNLAVKLEAATKLPIVAEYIAAKAGQAA